jgi:hypothetical protein
MSQLCDYNMKLWRLKSFTLPDCKTPLVKEWFVMQSEDVQAAFLVRMKDLQRRPGNGWDRPNVGQLRGKCKGLFEIVLKVNKVQHRPLGYFSGKMEFTFLAFATERDGKFNPPDVCKTAQNRKSLIENEGRVCEIDF